LLALAGCAAAVVAGGVVWALRYQPLDAGIRGVRGYEPGLRPDGLVPHVSVELTNTGRAAVKVTDVDAGRDTAVSFDREFVDPGGPLRPFTLNPGRSRALVISSSVPICTDRRPDDFRAPGRIRVSFEVYGIDREASVGEIREPQFNDDQRCILAAEAP
jgi:hypothetical protein